MAGVVVKACACGRSYDAGQWAELPAAGQQTTPWGEVLELRHCLCGSTPAIVVQEGAPDANADAR